MKLNKIEQNSFKVQNIALLLLKYDAIIRLGNIHNQVSTVKWKELNDK